MLALKLSFPGPRSPGVISYLESRTNAITVNVHMDDMIVLSIQKLHIFVSCGPLEPHQSMFSKRKRCPIGSLT